MIVVARPALVLLATLALVLPAAPAVAADPPPANVVQPTISGTPQVGEVLTVDPGQWEPAATSYRYLWLRDGAVIRTTDVPTRTLTTTDHGARIQVRVFATGPGGTGKEVTPQTTAIKLASLTPTSKPTVTGVRRWGQTLTGSPGTWEPAPASVRYVWFRGTTRVATGRRYTLRVADYGRRINLRVWVERPGYRPTFRESGFTSRIKHRVRVRRTFSYRVETRGSITTSVADFRRLSQVTFDHPLGWRAAGFAFRRVDRGGDFTLVLAQASWLPRFSAGCSSQWSCRVGRYVVVNQDRWKHASPSWNAAGRSLRDYRHMVVNHETGHWLGHGHLGCPGSGRLAPVMMQQSKGTAGCRLNPFPLGSEWWSSRARYADLGLVSGPPGVDVE